MLLTKNNSDILLVSFAAATESYAKGFIKVAEDLGWNAIHVQGDDAWYTNGFVKLDLQSFKSKYIVFVGSSMGGFGALLYGLQYKPDLIITFCPQVSRSHDFSLEQLDLSLSYKHSPFSYPVVIHCAKLEGRWNDWTNATKFAKKYKPTEIKVHKSKSHQLLKSLYKKDELLGIVKNDVMMNFSKIHL